MNEQLSPEVIAEIENLRLTAKRVADGALVGLHRSKRKGSSVEFSEHKAYAPGDDIRHIDWRAFAKSERLHVKQFEDETNLSLIVWVDASGSMDFPSGADTRKWDHAKTLAGAISYLALRQGDSVVCRTVSTDRPINTASRATGSHLSEILRKLGEAQPSGSGKLAEQLASLARAPSRRALVVLISDLFEAPEKLEPALAGVVAQGHELAVFHTMAPEELSFDYEQPAMFHDLESPRKLFMHPRTYRRVYQQELKTFLERTKKSMGSLGVDYLLCPTDQPANEQLGAFLRARQFASRRSISQ